ncbi:MAG: nickel transporter, partial [Deltaproteobacteria bacterium]|nr:nickel transporter [Deltaproteobacteria bacterium]
MRALVALTLALILCAAAGDAHPLGMASVNRYLGVKAHAQELELDHLLDLAEIPAWAEIERLDGDHDGRVTPAEREAG